MLKGALITSVIACTGSPPSTSAVGAGDINCISGPGTRPRTFSKLTAGRLASAGVIRSIARVGLQRQEKIKINKAKYTCAGHFARFRLTKPVFILKGSPLQQRTPPDPGVRVHSSR